MHLKVERLKIKLNPDFKKTIPRFFNTGDTRSLALIKKIMEIPDVETSRQLQQLRKEFSGHYRSIDAVLMKHYRLIEHLIDKSAGSAPSEDRKLLIGAYFTMEYAFEAAALFNPSVVEAPDQAGAGPGETNIIVSFRATGESHISSLIFKKGKLDKNGMVHLEPDGPFTETGEVSQQRIDNKTAFGDLLNQMDLPEDIRPNILSQLNEPFTYKEIETAIKNVLVDAEPSINGSNIRYEILTAANTSYELSFPEHSQLSERVIFPVTITEKNGIEDARFVKFTKENGENTYLASYTAYDGSFILPHLIETVDFCHFKMSPLHGKAAINKNLALFPRKVGGRYVMISRIDGVNNYIMFSEDLYQWDTAWLWQQPKYPWEFVQIGNAGSPIETSEGWLVITHGVGPMRKYCLGASLFDLDDPRKELGRLKEPLLVPVEHERHGYVPNVVYSCGSMVHDDHLIIPYAVSDYASSFARVSLHELLQRIRRESDSAT